MAVISRRPRANVLGAFLADGESSLLSDYLYSSARCSYLYTYLQLLKRPRTISEDRVGQAFAIERWLHYIYYIYSVHMQRLLYHKFGKNCDMVSIGRESKTFEPFANIISDTGF